MWSTFRSFYERFPAPTLVKPAPARRGGLSGRPFPASALPTGARREVPRSPTANRHLIECNLRLP